MSDGPSQNLISKLNNRNYNTFDKFKSPGIDGIWTAVLQNEGQITSELVHIKTVSLSSAYVPMSWRRVLVKFIPKP